MDYKFHKIQYHEDDRAQRLFDPYNIMPGQLNLSYVNSTEHIVAWHKHNIQTDYWCCIKGSFKVGLASNDDVEWEYLSDKNFRVLEVPAGIYHGYKALEPNSVLMYYLTEKYNPDDEIRARVGDFNEDWNVENK